MYTPPRSRSRSAIPSTTHCSLSITTFPYREVLVWVRDHPERQESSSNLADNDAEDKIPVVLAM